MAKPRNSILYMFDPLQQSPTTPCRDSSSPELSPSDKENDVPPGDLTVFFSRTYAAHKQQHVQVFTPKGKLIDIGDTPARDRHWDAAEHDGSDADGEQSESDVEGCGALSLPRIPLADLDVENTPRPLGAGNPFKAPVFTRATSPSHDPTPLPGLLVPAPQGSPLAEVINSINFSALTLLDDHTPATSSGYTQGTQELEHSRPSSPFPEINVMPETPIVDEFDILNDQGRTQCAIASTSHLRPPSTLTQLSPDDPRRTSVDLHSSFHLQMQSAEMSFDLLNDKVSFLGHGQDSFWSGGDDALEFEEMSLPPAMRAKMDMLLSVAEDPTESIERVASPPSGPFQASEAPCAVSPTTEMAMNVPLPLSPAYSVPPSRNITPHRLLDLTVNEPPSPPTSPVVGDEPSLLLESEPLPPPTPPPVPALRIVKKTWKMTRQQAAVPPPPSVKGGTVTQGVPKEKPEFIVKRRISLVQPKSAPAPQTARPIIRGVQRPPANIAGGVVIGLPPQGPSSTTASSSSSGTSTGTCTTRATEGSAPVSRFAGIQRPNLAAKERAAPRSTSGTVRSSATTAPGAKMMYGPTRATSGAPPKLLGVGASAIRPPARIVAPGAGSSALPKPVSRLPGPSGMTRTASMSSTSAAANNGTTASRARASTLSRTTGRF